MTTLAAVTKPAHAISNRRLKDYISSRENRVLQCPVMTLYARFTYSLFWPNKLSSARWYHKYREVPDIDITNTGNYQTLMSQIQGTTGHWCHKYRELPGNEIANTGNYLTLISQIQGTIRHWCHKYRELPGIDVTNTGNYLAMKSQIHGTTWHWYHKYRALPETQRALFYITSSFYY